jgi:TetR/AcrR family transcriptional regulator, transcriptional repressor for nem operon
MKVSKAQASGNRDAIVQAAAAQIRGRGFEHMSVADVAHAAGLTHGALYSHFKSKDALKAEAIKCAFDDCVRTFSGLTPSEFLARYLSAEHRDSPEEGCPTSALVSEVRWQLESSQMAFRDGIERFAALTGESLESIDAEHSPDRAMLMFAAMVGGLALSRAIREVDEPTSDNILRAITDQLEQLIAASAKKSKRRGR